MAETQEVIRTRTEKRTKAVSTERILGAKHALNALRCLASIGDREAAEDQSAAAYFAQKTADLAAIKTAAAGLDPLQQGFFMTLAEYIHCIFESGTPNLKNWTPDCALTEAEMTERCRAMDADELPATTAAEIADAMQKGLSTTGAESAPDDGGFAQIENNERVSLALEATWEIEGLISAILRTPRAFEAHDSIPVRGMVLRISALNDAISAALGDDAEKVDDIFKMINGVCRAETQAVGAGASDD